MTRQVAGANYVTAFLTMVILFFVVGFLTTVNTQFQAPLKEAFLDGMGSLKNTFATLITFSWFLAYPVCGGLGSKWVNAYGYRSTLVRGLVMMSGGLLLFFASSWMSSSYPDVVILLGGLSLPPAFLVFLLGSFTVGGSATVLQVVINPYLSACEVKGTQSVQRLAIGGSANAIGTTVAPYFVSGIVFGGVAVESVEVGMLMVPFLILAALMMLIGLGLCKVPLPDISGTRADDSVELSRSVWSFRHLTLGVVAIFFYVGAEVCIGANITMYAHDINMPSPALIATVYWGGILVGRLVGSTLSTVPPRVQLTVTTTFATLLTIASIAADSPWMLAAVGLCHSIMWGAIFTLAVKDLGRYTTIASGVFMIGVVGGAILPLLQGVLADISGSWRQTWWLVAASEMIMLAYALWGSRIRPGDTDTEK
ncbi:MAG: MFS transporter [Muribaculaceae bacterium]|nr:MFS transporter [Muribaculaceae bacterium]MDE6809024.1 MFS transporter [Muribaculaceae bacterium]